MVLSCRICLTYNVKMHKLDSTELKNFIEDIFQQKGFNDKLTESNFVCYICKALLVKSFNFVQRALRAQEVLNKLLNMNQMITATMLTNIDRVKLNLNHTGLNATKANVSFMSDDCKENEKDGVDDTGNKELTFQIDLINNIKPETNDLLHIQRIKSNKEKPHCSLTTNLSETNMIRKLIIEGNNTEKEVKMFAKEIENIKVEFCPTKENLCENTNLKEIDYCNNVNEPSITVCIENTSLKPEKNIILDKLSDNKSIIYSITPETYDSNSYRGNLSYHHNSVTDDKYNINSVAKPSMRSKSKLIAKACNLRNSSSQRNYKLKADKSSNGKREPRNPISNKSNKGNKNEDVSIQASGSDNLLIDYYDKGKRCTMPPDCRMFPLTCEKCDFIISNKTEHYLHYVYVHPTIKYPYRRNKSYICEICGSDINPSRYNDHILAHGKRTVKCEKCNKMFHSRRRMLNHMKNVHTKRYICDYCSKQFGTKTEIRTHMRIHTGEKPFKCHICGTGFAHYGNVGIHIHSKHQNSPNMRLKKLNK